jgi:hypothetical protein
MRNSTRRRLGRISKVFRPYAEVTPERMEEIYRLLDACVAAEGGQRPNESRADAAARGLGLSSGAELLQQLKDRARCGRTYDGGWPASARNG